MFIKKKTLILVVILLVLFIVAIRFIPFPTDGKSPINDDMGAAKAVQAQAIPTATRVVCPDAGITDSFWWNCAATAPLPVDTRFINWTMKTTFGKNWWEKTFRVNENEWRTERATIVWSYLCQIGGECPTVRDMAAWLLYQEGSIVIADQKGTEIMVKALRYKLSEDVYAHNSNEVFKGDGMTMSDLSFFTTFINPVQDGMTFSKNDWKELTTKPAKIYFDMVDRYWTDDSYPILGKNRSIVQHWWEPVEGRVGEWEWYYSVHDSSGKLILDFGS
jgi:hypothetical protein